MFARSAYTVELFDDHEQPERASERLLAPLKRLQWMGSEIILRDWLRCQARRCIDVTPGASSTCRERTPFTWRPQLLEAEARIATYEASKYLTEIAEAWVHTYPVRYDTLTGEVELPGAGLVMTADGDSLTLRLTSSDPGKFAAARLSVARHVDRVAERDAGVRCIWRELS